MNAKLLVLAILVALFMMSCGKSADQAQPGKDQPAAEQSAPMYPGVAASTAPTATASGLKYFELVAGNGATAETGKQVVVHYTGYLTNGFMFQSSLDRDEAIAFTLGVGEVIKGWDEGIAGMKVGGKRKLIIPSQLGYGERGNGPIPPNAELIFDIELLDVK